nr:BTAD domain-containing putative transcriptional regulator [Amycolatopsis umgeniensis]
MLPTRVFEARALGEGEIVIDIAVLGEVGLSGAEGKVDIGPARQRLVLAALALDVGQVVSDERLIERVWGTEPPSRAKGTLHSYVSRLRRALKLAGGHGKTGGLLRRSGGHVLDIDESSVDWHRFRRAVESARRLPDEAAESVLAGAIELWRGEALTGLSSEWATAERDRLGEARLTAECALTETRLSLGTGADLVGELSARSARHPLDERVAAQYLLALHRAGRTADALEHFRLVRTRLVEELGTEPGPILQQVHQQVLESGRNPHQTAGEPGFEPSPRQLPTLSAALVGRNGELSRLDDLHARSSRSGARRLTVVSGAGGIGKTWLALGWARRRADDHPDGQLFADLNGFSPDQKPRDPSDVLQGFLDALGVPPQSIPPGLDARAALFRGLVDGKRILVLIDNAATTEQVSPLLPSGPGCTILITSRNRLSGLGTAHGAHHLRLDTLTDDHAEALLVDRLGAARVVAAGPAIQRLIGLTGGFPLALSIVAGRADQTEGLGFDQLAAELTQFGIDALADGDPIASLPAVLSWSTNALTPGQAELFSLLSIAPGVDIDPFAAAGLAGISPQAAYTTLRELEHASLLSQEPNLRYQMHDLVRRYAVDSHPGVPDAGQDKALLRLTDSYLRTASAGIRLISPQRTLVTPLEPVPGATRQPLADRDAALAWFEAERQNILAVQALASEKGWHDYVWHLAWELEFPLHRGARHHDGFRVWELAAAAAAHLEDPEYATIAYRNAGLAAVRLGRTELAETLLRRALVLAEAGGDEISQAHVNYAMAALSERTGQDESALTYVTRALTLFRASERVLPVWESAVLNALGWYSARVGRYAEARAHCEAGLASARALAEGALEANALDSLGFIAHHTGEHQVAVTRYEEALAAFRSAGDEHGEADTLRDLAHPHLALGRTEAAIDAWRGALTLYKRQLRTVDAHKVEQELARIEEIDGRSGPLTC